MSLKFKVTWYYDGEYVTEIYKTRTEALGKMNWLNNHDPDPIDFTYQELEYELAPPLGFPKLI